MFYYKIAVALIVYIAGIASLILSKKVFYLDRLCLVAYRVWVVLILALYSAFVIHFWDL